ncbi:MAG: glycine cleavage system protein GcvH [Bacteroidetes bacterium]|nr:glycine cleavage system protein GcvH [Bacteroidota bacterium]MBU1680963.1 glycine cleavage system protein GcvH [Bacteroidota bacterium]
MNIPGGLKYTKEHEWLKVEGNIGTIGITDFAQGELGDVVFVDIDPNLDSITANESFGTIEAVKTVSELFAPSTGKILEINSKLENEPQLLNSDPYGEGWLIKFEIADLCTLDDLLDAEAYSSLLT